MSKDFDFNFEFDKGMIGGLIMLVIFPPAGILMLVNRFRKYGRGKNKHRQMRNMGVTTMAASLFYMFLGFPGWALASLLSGLGLTVMGQRGKKREERFRKYLAIIGSHSPVSLSAIAAKANESTETVEKDLQDMIDMGFFGLDTYIDHNRRCIVLDGVDDADWTDSASSAQGGYNIHVDVDEFVKTASDIFHTVRDEFKSRSKTSERGEQPKQAEQAAPAQAGRRTTVDVAPEKPQEQPAQEDQFGRTLSQIRTLNDRIKDKEISAKIDQIEAITAHIFGIVRKKPERIGEIRKFMNYYLPTTLKLLDSYAMLEEQGIEGDNITASKQQISQIMDTLIVSFKKQLDQLFKTQALDISSDIEVMDKMLAADGLKESDFKVQQQGGH